MKKSLSIENIIAVFKAKNYKLFENDEQDYNLNVFGIRAIDMTPNSFNDIVGLLWKYKGTWNLKLYSATTDPGSYYLLNPCNVKGTGIVCEGQYAGAYKVGLHKGYKALQQVSKMKYFRDNDKDNQFDLDPETITEEIAASNIHHAGQNSTVVENWSAACQVLAKMKDWDEFIDICDKASKIHGNSFTYTLINENDI